MGRGTDLVVMVSGDGSVATSTYAVATACADKLVMWALPCCCHWEVHRWLGVVERCEAVGEVKEVGGRMDGWWWWLRMQRFVCS